MIERSALPKTVKRDLIAAVSKVIEIIGLPAENISCNPADMNPMLFGRRAAAYGLSAGYFSQIVSRLRRALCHFGLHADKSPGDAALRPAWRNVLKYLPKASAAVTLRGFAHWCSKRGIDPSCATIDLIIEFEAWEGQTRLFAGYAQRCQQLARGWREVRKAQPNPESLPILTAPRKREPYVPHLASFPQSFQDDMALYRSTLAREGRKFFSGRGTSRGPNRPLALATINLREFALRQAAAALMNGGMPIEDIHQLRDIVTPVERPEKILDYFYSKAGEKVGGQLWNIAETMRQTAKFHAGLPEEEWRHLQVLAGDASPNQQSMSAKAREHLRALIAADACAMMLHLPDLLFERATDASLLPKEAARLVRTAIIIELLTFCPLRLRNLRNLKLGINLTWVGRDADAHMAVLIDAADTKNKSAITWTLPPVTSRRIQTFIDRYRSVLAKPGNPYLFPGGTMEPLAVPSIQSTLQETVAEEIGVHVYPHLMRHFAVWLFLQTNPGQYEMARRVLHHKRVETTIKFYAGLETDAAAKAFQNAVMGKKAETTTKALAAFARRGGTTRKATTSSNERL